MITKKKVIIALLFVATAGLIAFNSRVTIQNDFTPARPVNPGICGTFGDYIPDPYDTTQPLAPRLPKLGTLHHQVTTDSKEAQEFFDQGMRLCFAFNMKEAHRAFMESARLDPNCAMAYWGQAFALGPNLNESMPFEREQRAYKALQKAIELKSKASAQEQMYIDALSARYKDKEHKERGKLDSAFMFKMKQVAEALPNDQDANSLYADAIMNTMPWKYWDAHGDFVPLAKVAKEILERSLKRFPNHPGLHHCYIHLVEASNNPYLGVESAAKIEELMPGAGHIIHMPSHIYIRTGHFDKAVSSNERAIAADEEYIAACQVGGTYPLGYYPHNIHFLSFAAAMQGQQEKALHACLRLQTKYPANSLEKYKGLQRLQVAQYHINVRFGKWNELLILPEPSEKLFYSQVVYHYAKGLAYAKKGDRVRSDRELNILDSLSQHEEIKKTFVNLSKLTDVCMVASNIIKGEQALSESPAEAISFFKQAREFEKLLVYSEPPTWSVPVNHFLGDAYLKNKQYAEAEQTFREDQAMFPMNGWSLYGLYMSLKEQGKAKEADSTLKQFQKAWQHSDTKIESSVF
jgi:tetratricopeptide (TPR) repeat protein